MSGVVKRSRGCGASGCWRRPQALHAGGRVGELRRADHIDWLMAVLLRGWEGNSLIAAGKAGVRDCRTVLQRATLSSVEERASVLLPYCNRVPTGTTTTFLYTAALRSAFASADTANGGGEFNGRWILATTSISEYYLHRSSSNNHADFASLCERR